MGDYHIDNKNVAGDNDDKNNEKEDAGASSVSFNSQVVGRKIVINGVIDGDEVEGKGRQDNNKMR